MALHLITGYAGSEHITSKDQGAYNMATFGSGNFVLDRGEKFKNAVASNNSITIYDGEAMLQGRFIKMPAGTTESVTIENGASGQTRNDLICIRYTKNTTDNTESASLVVIKGTPNGGDPSYNTGLITDGDANVSDFPLYRVSLNGINIASVTALFSVKVSMTTYMSNYQMPNATSTSKGAVQIGSGINVSNGVISVTPYSLPTASSSTKGGVKIGSGINVSGDVISVPTPTPYSLPTATSDTLGGVKIGSGISISSGTISAKRQIKQKYVGLSGIFSGDSPVASGSTKWVTISLSTIASEIARTTGDSVSYTDIVCVFGATTRANAERTLLISTVDSMSSDSVIIMLKNVTTSSATFNIIGLSVLYYG